MAVLKQISPIRVPVAPNDSPSKYRPSSRAKSARMSPRIVDLGERFSNLSSSRAKSRDPVAERAALLRGSSTTLRFARNDEKTRIEFFDPGFEDFTPPVPFRWISRSLSVNGG